MKNAAGENYDTIVGNHPNKSQQVTAMKTFVQWKQQSPEHAPEARVMTWDEFFEASISSASTSTQEKLQKYYKTWLQTLRTKYPEIFVSNEELKRDHATTDFELKTKPNPVDTYAQGKLTAEKFYDFKKESSDKRRIIKTYLSWQQST